MSYIDSFDHEYIGQLDQVTQQNAALVEESAATATSLNDQAGTLVQLVSVFNLGDTAGHAQPSLSYRPAIRQLSH